LLGHFLLACLAIAQEPLAVGHGAGRFHDGDEGGWRFGRELLRQGLRQLVKARPDDPFEFLANYIRDANPNKKA
jgi:hypothetical protein